MGHGNRLTEGGRIDRDRPIAFTFNGKRYRGFVGDTLASALLANGVTTLARSFKYHRPRGIFSAGSEEPSAVVQVGTGNATRPCMKATEVELCDGLTASSVNGWPSLAFDLGAAADFISGLLPAGFYYKTFFRPKGAWRTAEKVMRHAAGLGHVPPGPDPERYDHMHAHCDVLIVGAGPAGLAAAAAAARTGARVIVADEQTEFGGSLLNERIPLDDKPAEQWVAATVKGLEAVDEVRLLPRATVFGYYDHNLVAILERRGGSGQRLWKVRAKQVVLATGAIERPIAFANNDLPGVMLAGAARAYVNRYAAKPGRRAVVFTNNDDAYRTALDLTDAGITVAAVIDSRPNPDGPLPDLVSARDIAVLDGSVVVAARGFGRVGGVDIMDMDGVNETATGEARRIKCDLVCVSGGWNPAVHLFSQSGGKVRYEPGQTCFVPGDAVQPQYSAGSANGAFPTNACLAEGARAGARAAAAAGYDKRGVRRPPKAPEMDEQPPRPLWMVPTDKGGRRRGKAFVDLQTDVTTADVALAAREGYASVEHLKRYTGLGMGTDQGKTGNVVGLALLARELGSTIEAVGTTTFRPPYAPVPMGALAGRAVGEQAEPVRTTPLHQWHLRTGAVFEDTGRWRRPRYYPQGEETLRQAVDRECLATRNAVALLDASTLGKIDVHGPDAARFLDRIYTNDWDDLKVGRCRYGLMLGENGMVMDDGVTLRLADDHFLVSTTSGGADAVLEWMEEWLQGEWPDLDVHLTAVTEQWATMTVCGPLARPLLAELTAGIDLDAKAFPFMSFRDGSVAGIPARLLRLGFLGEVCFEVNVPAGSAVALWSVLTTAGGRYGITPFGVEALSVLRAERGHFIVGVETDGTVTPGDLGMERLLSATTDFIGKRSLRRADSTRPDRPQLVGLLTEKPEDVLPEGAQIVADSRARPPVPMIGHVTSSYHSATLGRSIALALLDGGRDRHGETVHVPLGDRTVRAVVASPTFYDPEGTRLHG